MVNFQSLQQQGQAWVEQAVFWAQSPKKQVV